MGCRLPISARPGHVSWPAHFAQAAAGGWPPARCPGVDGAEAHRTRPTDCRASLCPSSPACRSQRVSPAGRQDQWPAALAAPASAGQDLAQGQQARHSAGVGVEVSSRCGQGHTASVLCCRLAHEIAVFLDTRHGWWCHFDDDNYVNTVAVEAMLASYDSRRPWYIGRASSDATYGRGSHTQLVRFATGGAGFCVSRAALMQATKGILHGQFESACARLRLPDDVTLGHILWNSSRVRLTHVDEFHSHLEPLAALPRDSLAYQVSLSYFLQRHPPNTVDVEGLDREQDPTRFISLHCLLHGLRKCS
ncbi:fringe glycosyltransferase-like isoform X2 [Amphibalanus amphitrite]|uniref:fringe glycosyltransferase-like isoform X2 n=1 Tax=Amphibalanus amphitrite TaxID=1232801 RepID=UPI001C9107B2|nr:fringe glycosyltransferase-like isoform X2 [Amphibalanus amphitrite]